MDGERPDAKKPEVFESTTATIMRRNRWWLALASTPWMAIGALAITALAIRNPAPLAPSFHFAIFGLIAFLFAYKRNRNPRFVPGSIRADAEGVRQNGELLVRREEIKQGFVVPHAGRHVVRLVKKGPRPSLNVAVESVDEGRRLLRALGLDASQTVAEVRAMSRIFSMPAWKQMALYMSPAIAAFIGMAIGMGSFGKGGAAFGPMLMVVAYPFLLTMILIREKVQIGADGILTRWMGRQRYFPFSQIEWVNPWEGAQLNKRYTGVELVLRSGEKHRILVGQKRWSEEERGLLLERISESIEAYKSGMFGTDASILGRNGRAPTDWITALRAIGTGANADMRTSPIPLERLWQIVEDASAAAVARASAAVALVAQVPVEERTRIRVAARATASPKLRVALEQATEPEITDQALAEALAELEAEQAGAEKPAHAHA